MNQKVFNEIIKVLDLMAIHNLETYNRKILINRNSNIILKGVEIRPDTCWRIGFINNQNSINILFKLIECQSTNPFYDLEFNDRLKDFPPELQNYCFESEKELYTELNDFLPDRYRKFFKINEKEIINGLNEVTLECL